MKTLAVFTSDVYWVGLAVFVGLPTAAAAIAGFAFNPAMFIVSLVLYTTAVLCVAR